MKYFFGLAFLFIQSMAFAQLPNSARTNDSLPPPIRQSNPLSSTANTTHSASFDIPGQDIDWGRFGIATGVLAASVTGLHILQYNSWWANQRGPFHVEDDPGYEHNFDKYGHAFGGYYTSHFFYEAYSWTGMDSSQATLLAAICGAMYEFYVEIEDGYAKDWGFSPGDAKADIAGAVFYVLRNRIDFLRNFQYKWFYYPSGEKPYTKDQTINPLDDYGGQSYWMTVDIHRMLPETAKKYWPNWLNLAVGVSRLFLAFDSTSTDFFNQRKTAYYIGLDFDLEKLIPESSNGIINFIRRGLSYWHFPAPAYRISPDPRFFILFPLKMTIG